MAVAALIGAVALVFLVVFVAITLVKCGMAVDEMRSLAKQLHTEVDALSPRVDATLQRTEEVLSSVSSTAAQVQGQMSKVNDIASNASVVSGNVSTLSNLATLTVAVPVVKAASLRHGVRQAMNNRRPMGRKEARGV